MEKHAFISSRLFLPTTRQSSHGAVTLQPRSQGHRGVCIMLWSLRRVHSEALGCRGKTQAPRNRRGVRSKGAIDFTQGSGRGWLCKSSTKQRCSRLRASSDSSANAFSHQRYSASGKAWSLSPGPLPTANTAAKCCTLQRVPVHWSPCLAPALLNTPTPSSSLRSGTLR